MAVTMAELTRCRTSWTGHDWDDAPAPPGEERPAGRGWVHVHFRCSRCGRRKRYLFHPPDGVALQPTYSEGPTKREVADLTRAEWKQAFWRNYERVTP